MAGMKFIGRPPINFAESIKSIASLDDPYVKFILDRRNFIGEEFLRIILNRSIFSWEGRNPAPALDDLGNFQGTDFDLLTFMVPLAERGAIIEIPEYKNRRQILKKSGERKIGSNQFGKVTGLISHKDTFSFSVRIWDTTIARINEETGKESLGSHRSYMLVDCDCHWYDGWDCIAWNPSRKENEFLVDKNLWTNNSVIFKYFVHPNRWASVFGAPYLLLKLLWLRLVDEASFWRGEIKRLKELGFGSKLRDEKKSQEVELRGKTESIEVKSLEFILDMPQFFDSYEPARDSDEGLNAAHRREKLLTYNLRPKIQFITRADEAAYFLYGNGRVALWMKNRNWKPGFREPKGRIDWNIITFSNNCALRYRERILKQIISIE